MASPTIAPATIQLNIAPDRLRLGQRSFEAAAARARDGVSIPAVPRRYEDLEDAADEMVALAKPGIATMQDINSQLAAIEQRTRPVDPDQARAIRIAARPTEIRSYYNVAAPGVVALTSIAQLRGLGGHDDRLSSDDQQRIMGNFSNAVDEATASAALLGQLADSGGQFAIPAPAAPERTAARHAA